MEASGAGIAGAAAGDGQAQQQQQGQQGSQEGTQQQQESQQTSQLEGLATSEQLDELRSMIAEQFQPQQPEEPAEEAPQFNVDLADPTLDPAVAAEQLAQYVDQTAEAKVAQALAPVQAQLQELQSQQGADNLVAEFPALGNPENAQALVDFARQQAEIMGHPELATDFGFLRVAYLAARASEMAQQQNGAAGGAQAATLEGAAGSNPGGTQGAAPTADSIAEGWAQRSSVLPF